MEKDMSRAINLLIDSLNRIVPQLNRVEDDLARVQVQLNTTLEENRQLQYENEELRQRLSEEQANLQTCKQLLDREKERVKALELLEKTNRTLTQIRNACCEIEDEESRELLDSLWTKFDTELRRMEINLDYLKPGDRLPQDKMKWTLIPSEGAVDKSKLNTISKCQEMAIEVPSEPDGLRSGTAGYYDKVAASPTQPAFTQASPTQSSRAPEPRQEAPVQQQKPESRGGRQIAIADDDDYAEKRPRLNVCLQDGRLITSVVAPKILLTDNEAVCLSGSVYLTDSEGGRQINATVPTRISYRGRPLKWGKVHGIQIKDTPQRFPNTVGISEDDVYYRIFIGHDGTVNLGLRCAVQRNEFMILIDYPLTKLN